MKKQNASKIFTQLLSLGDDHEDYDCGCPSRYCIYTQEGENIYDGADIGNAAKALVEGNYLIKSVSFFSKDQTRKWLNTFYIKTISAGYTLDELLELGYTFKQANAILKKQEEEV